MTRTRITTAAALVGTVMTTGYATAAYHLGYYSRTDGITHYGWAALRPVALICATTYTGLALLAAAVTAILTWGRK